MGASEKLTLV